MILLDAWSKSYAAESSNPDASGIIVRCLLRLAALADAVLRVRSWIRPASGLYYSIITRALYGLTIESWTVNPAIDLLTVLIL